MPFPFLAAAIGAGALGSFISGGQQAAAMDRQSERDFAIGQERNRISKIGAETDQTMGANQLRRQQETNPLRDRVLFGLQNRAGMTPGRFRANDMFNKLGPGEQVSQGGIDTNALQQANDQFTPGAGGVRPEMLDQMMAKMGFGPPRPQEPDPRDRFRGGGPPRDDGSDGRGGFREDERLDF